MINWKPLTSAEKLQDLIRESHQHTVIIFKHSTRCNISSIAKMRLEDQWDSPLAEATSVYLIDVIADPAMSRQVSEQFEVYHESPQILMIVDGECTHDASHFDITVAELREVSLRPQA